MNDATNGAALRNDEFRTLLAQVAGGDQRAFATLYRRASPQLYAIAARIVGHAALADDVLQDAFVSIWHHAGTYDAAQSEPGTWLASIVRHRALDVLRRRDADTVRSPDDLLPENGPTPVDILLAGADARTIRDCVDTLDADAKQAIALAFFRGLSYVELAAHLHAPLRTVKSSVRRGLDRLRHCLGAAGAGG